MAHAIRQIGLKLVLALLRLTARPSARGWQRSRRRTDLRGV
jgi:hypothetical protein